ncbi:MAG: hypothetical protein K9L98_02595 [Candidatus Pacebacteria bacterium]|nr:hypothetical protein [Candidatus Paceibacterota bacterium]MCF7862873.1 hypothetical protein [Candidatus Paceibacterota bacterium]
MEEIHNRSLITVLVITAILAGCFLFFNFKEESRLKNIEIAEKEFLGNIKKEIESLDLKAKAISVYDVNKNKVVYGKNDGSPIPIASLSKTMTLITILPNINPEDVTSLSSLAISQNGDFGLYKMEKWKIKDLAEYAFMVSANDGIYALAEYWEEKEQKDLIEKMNEKAQRIGMKNASFFNFTGLDFEKDGELKAGALASALDVNLMSVHAYKVSPDIFESSVLAEKNFKSISGFEHFAKNTNVLIPQKEFLFSKTGNTTLAGGNLAVILKTKNENIFAISILGSTTSGRFADMEKIVDVLIDY